MVEANIADVTLRAKQESNNSGVPRTCLPKVASTEDDHIAILNSKGHDIVKIGNKKVNFKCKKCGRQRGKLQLKTWAGQEDCVAKQLKAIAEVPKFQHSTNSQNSSCQISSSNSLNTGLDYESTAVSQPSSSGQPVNQSLSSASSTIPLNQSCKII